MKNMVDRRFIFVQEEVKNLLSIIMGVIAEEAQDKNLEYFREKATLPKDIQLIQELQKSIQEIEKRAQEYQESIGISSVKPDKSSKKNISHVAESTSNEIESNIDMLEKEKQNTHSDHFDIEL